MNTAKQHTINHDTLERAVKQTQGREGANLQEITNAYTRQTNNELAPHEVVAGLRDLIEAGRLRRSKGPRGENTYLPTRENHHTPHEHLEHQKHQLQQALGTLTSAVTYATARLDQHQKREDQWRELIEANEEAKHTLNTTNQPEPNPK